MARVLITGATGLLGRRVLAAWPSDLEALPIGRPELDLLAPGAFTDAIDRHRPDVVLHLAWVASGTPGYRTDPANAQWRHVTREAARHALGAGIRFVGVGTGLDDAPASTSEAYAAAKRGVRTDLADVISSGEITWLRPFYVFDPERHSPAVLREAHLATEAGRPVTLGTPESRHDFVHAGDVGRAVVAAIVADLHGVVDIGAGTLRSVAELVTATGAAWTHGEPTASRHTDAVADVAALAATGWTPSETERYFAHD